MRIFVTVLALFPLAVVAAIVWVTARGPSDAEAKRIAAVLAPTAPAREPPAYAHCASCHLHDGSGRPDGSIPRLNGQRKTVIENKLHRLRAGTFRLPAMDPFARTLDPSEISEVAAYLSSLPETPALPTDTTDEEREQGAALYATHCASCHGDHAEGHDGLLASRLCGQYPNYLERRLREAAQGTRRGSDAVMQGVLTGVPSDALGPIVSWLSAADGCTAP